MPFLGPSTGQVLFRHKHTIPTCRVQGFVVDMLHETDELTYVGDPGRGTDVRFQPTWSLLSLLILHRPGGFGDFMGASMWYVETAWHGTCFILRSPFLLCSPGFRSCTTRS